MPKLFVIGGLLSRGASRGDSSGRGMLELVPTRCQTKKTAAIPNMDVAIIHGLFDMMVLFRILPVYDAAPSYVIENTKFDTDPGGHPAGGAFTGPGSAKPSLRRNFETGKSFRRTILSLC